MRVLQSQRLITPLDPARLERLALRYVERYATTRAKLIGYLQRKLRERGWAGPDEPSVIALVDRFVGLGYVDDTSFARNKASSMARRGLGERRVALALQQAGIGKDLSAAVRQELYDEEQAWQNLLRFARRRRIGPFGLQAADPASRHRQFAAVMRAGHNADLAERLFRFDPESNGDLSDLDD
jgi:regulatory protein